MEVDGREVYVLWQEGKELCEEWMQGAGRFWMEQVWKLQRLDSEEIGREVGKVAG